MASVSVKSVNGPSPDHAGASALEPDAMAWSGPRRFGDIGELVAVVENEIPPRVDGRTGIGTILGH